MKEAFEKALQENKYDLATHKAYADWLMENGFDSDAEFHAGWTEEWQKGYDEGEEYFSNLARDHDVDYDSMMSDLEEYGEYTQEGGQSLQSAVYYDKDLKEFKKHWKNFKGVEWDGKWGDDCPFSCSC